MHASYVRRLTAHLLSVTYMTTVYFYHVLQIRVWQFKVCACFWK